MTKFRLHDEVEVILCIHSVYALGKLFFILSSMKWFLILGLFNDAIQLRVM